MLQAIKVGDVRVVANNIEHITVVDNNNLVKCDDGTILIGAFGDSDMFTDKQVDIYFLGGGCIRFLADEARDFLRQFDAMTGIAETDAVAEPVAATETGTLRDALPHMKGFVLDSLKTIMTSIIQSDAPATAKAEAQALKLAITREKRSRPHRSVYETALDTKD